MYYFEASNDYLAHHGIKGQRWGVRRYQNEDGSLTEAGKKRYYAETAVQKAKTEYRKASSNLNLDYSDANLKKYKKAKIELSYQKGKLGLAKQKKVSKHQQKLIEQYKAKGLTEEEARVAAYKRAKAEKIAIIAGATTLAAAATYIGVRHYDDFFDSTIKQGGPLKRIAADDTMSVHDAFYAANNKHDEKRYLGLYAKSIKDNTGSVPHQKILSVTSDIKQASRKTALANLKELAEDPSFRKDLESKINSAIGITPKQQRVVAAAQRALNAGKINAAVYNAFNFELPNRDSTTSKFYEHLRKKGYGAVEDLNDKFWSGYNSRSPKVIFDNSKVKVDDVVKLSSDKIEKQNMREYRKLFAGSMTMPITMIAGGVAANNAITASSERKAVAEYRKKHPNTKLSYSEIAAMTNEERNA